MNKRYELLAMLADGRFRSGQKIGKALGVTRNAVWKHIKHFEEWGLEVHSVRGRGHRLAAPLELLDSASIHMQLSESARALLGPIATHLELASTNKFLLAAARSGAMSGSACFAERQTAGRGRRGREWVSPFAANIYLSLYWRFERPPQALEGLGLAVGVAVLRAIRRSGLAKARLKWPNDVYVDNQKLAGILLEMYGEASGPSHVVIGVGLNVRMPERTTIDQPWINLETALGRSVSRNAVAASLLSELAEAAVCFDKEGIAPFAREWQRYDAIIGKEVILRSGESSLAGRALGIDPSGALLIDHGGHVQRYVSGDVSVRISQ